jgi:hypothetical protein
MGRNLVAFLPRDHGKWCAYVLILLTPGSFVFLPVVALIRFLAIRRQSERRNTCVPHTSADIPGFIVKADKNWPVVSSQTKVIE